MGLSGSLHVFKLNEENALRRHFLLYLVDETDGKSPELGEAGGQPQVSKNGGSFNNTSATLVAIGNGAYYVVLTQGEVDTLAEIMLRYKSVETEEFIAIGQVVAYDPYNAVPDVNISSISDDVAAADNLELQYDGTGLNGDPFPFRQDQGASIGGGLATHTAMLSVTVIEGSEQDLANANTADGSRWTGDDDGSGAEFIFRCSPANLTDHAFDLHFEGYYDEPIGATNGATLSVYNFSTTAWDSIKTFSNSIGDEVDDLRLLSAHRAMTDGTVETVDHTEGDVLIKFEQDAQETGDACLLIDLMRVGFVTPAPTAATIASTTWDEDLSSHNILKTAGDYIKRIFKSRRRL